MNQAGGDAGSGDGNYRGWAFGLLLQSRMRPMLRAPEKTLKATLDSLKARVRGEYREMPGMRLTIAQASRLWHLDARTCEAVLLLLVDEGFLTQTSSGAFVAVQGE